MSSKVQSRLQTHCNMAARVAGQPFGGFYKATLEGPRMSHDNHPQSPAIDSVVSFFTKIKSVRDNSFPNVKRLWFRGQSKHLSNWHLRPRIFDTSPTIENEVVQWFMAHAPARHPLCPTRDDYAGWLTLMRHYGDPTRLFDWSESPLTALYVAIQESDNQDGIVWILSPNQLNKTIESRHSPSKQMSFKMSEKGHLFSIADDRIVDSYIRSLFGDGHNWNNNLPPAAVYPSQLDLRMVVQQSMFTIHAGNLCLEHLQSEIKDYRFLYKVTILAANKYSIQEELSDLGFTLATMYPDLVHLGKWLDPAFPR